MQPFTLEFGRFRLELGGSQTCIMGILNATPDSFSDGGKFNTFDTAVRQGLKLVEDGAHILDIGGESSRPFAAPVSEQQELDRVIPVIEALSKQIDIPISIDTVKSGVAKEALNAGAAIINDISAFEKDPAMADLAAQKNVPVVLMHMKGTPETMQVNPGYDDLMLEITTYLSLRADYAMQKGVQKHHIILDPGIGFGKTVAHNLVLINHLEKITALGFPVLMGPSRKSFIQNILSQKEMTPVGADSIKTECGTLAAVAASILNGAHIVRVHDVEKVTAFTHIIDSIRNA
ncbi:MAG: dihydropteroate synthase [Proteobacteria bacterium]|nr:dihydropteroate synthase [Pseudomonadota bacterium]MBU1585817.1 dihydropteroate synthase [Pseudomonadota bacterium]MBU2452221.1 dihydropteroate synthase [Pseudomonadota bacterium]MBU2631051.1 dihydropteroate synthase [Pseudomonadota bacterium]